MCGRLAEKGWLITGSSGIAEATALLSAKEGARVFLIGKDAASVASLIGRIRAEGGHCDSHVADLTDSAATEKAVDACAKSLGHIDALFHAAGISGRKFGDGPLHQCTEEGWDITLDTNLKSAFRLCGAVLRYMLKQPLDANGIRGTILNMSSVLAFSPESHHFATHAYAASKAAIIGLGTAMAAYYAPYKIRVNTIAPGLVRTPMSARAQKDEELLKYLTEKQPLAETLIDPAEIASAAVFLLSDESRATTGIVFPVDAGWSVS